MKENLEKSGADLNQTKKKAHELGQVLRHQLRELQSKHEKELRLLQQKLDESAQSHEKLQQTLNFTKLNHQAMQKRCQKQSQEIRVLRMQLQTQGIVDSTYDGLQAPMDPSKQLLNLSVATSHSLTRMPVDDIIQTEELQSVTKSIVISPKRKNDANLRMFQSVSPSNYFKAIERVRSRRNDFACRTPNDSTALLKKPIEGSGHHKLPKLRQSMPAVNQLLDDHEQDNKSSQAMTQKDTEFRSSTDEKSK